MIASRSKAPAASSVSTRLWQFLGAGVVLILCLPFWVLPSFPSQDGPSHLYNAAVECYYRDTPIYQEYFEIHYRMGGNLLTSVLLAQMMKVLPPLLAEKVLLTLYVVLFFFSARLVLTELTSHAGAFASVALIFAPNWFLHAGFWNFLYSLPLFLFSLYFYLRYLSSRHVRWLVLLMLSSLATYAAHVSSAGLLAVTVACFAGAVAAGHCYRTVARHGRIGRRDLLLAARELALPLLCLAPVLILSLYYSRELQGAAVYQDVPLRARFRPFYIASPLGSGDEGDRAWVRAFAGFMAAWVLAAILVRMRRLQWTPADVLLALSFVFVLSSSFGPVTVGVGDYVQERFAFYAWLLLFLWLAGQPWPAFAARGFALAGGVLLLAIVQSRAGAYSRWSNALADVRLATANIAPNSTVLPVMFHRPPGSLCPLLHPIGLRAPVPLVDLANYEALSGVFSVAFRPSKTPFTLTDLRNLEHDGSFDIPSTERRVGATVDYVLLQSGDAGRWREIEQRIGTRLADFTLTYQSPHGRARLYRRLGESPRTQTAIRP